MSNAGAVQAIVLSDDFFYRVRGTVIIEMTRGNGDLFSPTDALDNGATTWTQRHRELIAGIPGFAEDVAYAIASGNENWATDQAVISDLEILSAVQWARTEVKKHQLSQSFQEFLIRKTAEDNVSEEPPETDETVA